MTTYTVAYTDTPLVTRAAVMTDYDGAEHKVTLGAQFVYCDEYLSCTYDIPVEDDAALRRLDVIVLDGDGNDWFDETGGYRPKGMSACTGISEHASTIECVTALMSLLEDIGGEFAMGSLSKITSAPSWWTDDYTDSLFETQEDDAE